MTPLVYPWKRKRIKRQETGKSDIAKMVQICVWLSVKLMQSLCNKHFRKFRNIQLFEATNDNLFTHCTWPTWHALKVVEAPATGVPVHKEGWLLSSNIDCSSFYTCVQLWPTIIQWSLHVNNSITYIYEQYIRSFWKTFAKITTVRPFFLMKDLLI